MDSASTKLSNCRAGIREARRALQSRLEEMIRDPNNETLLQDAIITEREGRYVIPVKAEHKRDIAGITHDISNTGATVFVEPWEAVEMGNTIRELVAEERHEVERILQELSADVGVHAGELGESVSRLADLDLALAKARYARDVKAAVPVLMEFSGSSKQYRPQPYIKLVGARHPLLGRKAVPLSIEIGRDFTTLIITGPNTGGKTVALKTVGLLSAMTRAGIPVPASPDSCIPMFDTVFADIGDEQSIEQTLSSFSWHMSNMVRILKNATSRSLVLLDELGTSTDPAEGSALARSILASLLEQGIMTVATTHYADLKAFAHVTPGMQNASLDFDPVTLNPTYHMTLGIPGGSNALSTAQHLGIPEAIVENARSMLSQGALDLEATLPISWRSNAGGESASAGKRSAGNAASKGHLMRSLKKLGRTERAVTGRTRWSADADLNRLIRRANADLRRQVSRESVESARKAMRETQKRLSSGVWAPKDAGEDGGGEAVSPGDTVRLEDFNLTGTILSVSNDGKEVEVQAGQTKIRVNIGSIEKAEAPAGKNPGNYYQAYRAAGTVAHQLDLRGRRAEEIEPAVDSYLNDASMANLSQAVIVHGHGTGTVKQIVRDYLSRHPLVRAFRPGQKGEGGDGATVVTF
jgi:DNA mismatch repair protein MutS2